MTSANRCTNLTCFSLVFWDGLGLRVRLCASTKSHASGKIKNRSFRILRIGSSDVFFDADSESPHMT